MQAEIATAPPDVNGFKQKSFRFKPGTRGLKLVIMNKSPVGVPFTPGAATLKFTVTFKADNKEQSLPAGPFSIAFSKKGEAELGELASMAEGKGKSLEAQIHEYVRKDLPDDFHATNVELIGYLKFGQNLPVQIKTPLEFKLK